MKLDRSIMRVFEVRALPGKSAALKKKFADTSVSVVDGKPGNLGYLFGTSLSTDDHDLVFISMWNNMDSIKSNFGDQWQESYLPEGYEELIESCCVRHVQCEGKLTF